MTTKRKEQQPLPQQGEVWINPHTPHMRYVCLYVDEGVGDTYYMMRDADDPYAFDAPVTQWQIARYKWRKES